MTEKKRSGAFSLPEQDEELHQNVLEALAQGQKPLEGAYTYDPSILGELRTGLDRVGPATSSMLGGFGEYLGDASGNQALSDSSRKWAERSEYDLSRLPSDVSTISEVKNPVDLMRFIAAEGPSSAVPSIAAIGAGAATIASGGTAPMVAASAGLASAPFIFGGSHRENIQSGMSPEEAVKYTTMIGAANTAIEAMGGEILLSPMILAKSALRRDAAKAGAYVAKKTGSEISGQAVKEVAEKSALDRFGRGFARGAFTEGGVEAAQEAVQMAGTGDYLGENLFKRDGATERILNAAVLGAATGGIMGGPVDAIAGNKPATDDVSDDVGTRAKPADATKPAEVDKARQQVQTNPTEGQKEAGNYKKGHVKWKGMDLSIETLAGEERAGKDPNGKPWSVTMPADYGYIKGTNSADGEQVDVYMGEDRASDTVFLVDQLDAETGKFDEPKAILGMKDMDDAVATYDRGFSDGKGLDRIGNMTELTTQEFKDWLEYGDTTKPYAPPQNVPEKPVQKTQEKAQENTQANDEPVPSIDDVYSAIGERNANLFTGLLRNLGVLNSRGWSGLTDDQKRQVLQGAKDGLHKLKPKPEPKPKKAHVTKTKKNYKILGTNTQGNEVREDHNGVRSVIENGIELSEPVQFVPGGSPQIDVENRREDFLTVDEVKAKADAGPSHRLKKGRIQNGYFVEYDDYDDTIGIFSLSESDGYITEEGVDGKSARVDADASDELIGAVIEELRKGLDEGPAIKNAKAKIQEGSAGSKELGGGSKEPRPDNAEPRPQKGKLEPENTEPRPQNLEAGPESGEGGPYPKAGESSADAPVDTKSPEYGSKNKIVTKDEVEEIRRKIRANLKNKLNSGVDPELLVLGAKLAIYHIEAGARKWAHYVKAMVDDIGEPVRPYLRGWYEAVRHDPAAADISADMTSGSEIDAIESGKTQTKAPTKPAKKSTYSPLVEALIVHFADDGGGFKTIVQARKFGEHITGERIQPGTASAKKFDEDLELAIVLAARKIVDKGLSPIETYEALVDLYGRQPRVGVRTSTSMRNQAYSTPIPLAYLASNLAGIDHGTTVYEPSAGNGALVVAAAPENTYVNEIDDIRLENLEKQGFAQVGNNDATTFVPNGKFDVVIMNPPFGAVKNEKGDSTKYFDVDEEYSTREIDHAIAMKALEAMKDDGRAVLIVGGPAKTITSEAGRSHAYNGKAKREFYYKLYRQFNVVDHFNVPGELYSKQGAGWPVDVIVINGRGKSQLKLPAVNVPPTISSWEKLKEKIDGNEMGMGSPSTGGPRDGIHNPPSKGVGGNSGHSYVSGQDGVAGEGNVQKGRGGSRGGSRPVSGPNGSPLGGQGGGATVTTGGPSVSEQNDGENQEGAPNVGDGEKRPGTGGTNKRGDVSGRLGKNRPDRLRKPVDLEKKQVPYEPNSKADSLQTVVPTNMSDAIKDALYDLESQVGDIDEFVASKINIPAKDLPKYLAAEQIDAVALAIHNMDKQEAFIIGDQTGIGKGRVVAAMIKYALEEGKTPIFVTVKADLFNDILRDMHDIGMKDIRPFVTNGGVDIHHKESGIKIKTPKNNNPAVDKALDEGTIGKHNMIFTTYSQLQTVKGSFTNRNTLIDMYINNSIVVFDESHLAGGSKQAGQERESKKPKMSDFVRGMSSKAHGVMFSSATYAKRPEVMDLYAKTGMRYAVTNIKELGERIRRGGVPMQQIVASMLARAGQYIRRERLFDGIDYNTPEVEVDKKTYRTIANIFNEVTSFDKNYAEKAKKGVAQNVKEEAQSMGYDGSIGGAGITSTNFTAVLHNLVAQMLLSLKVRSAAELAIQQLKDGKKPILTVANTMGSFIEEYAKDAKIAPGDPIDITFNTLLNRYIERTRRYTLKQPFQKGSGEVKYISDIELGPEGLAEFKRIKKLIKEADLSLLPVSPIDMMHKILRDAGYKTAEITGRQATIDYGEDFDRYIVRTGKDKDVAANIKTISDFNNGVIDAVIVNQSGSTGISMHSSPKAGSDVRQRVMNIVQPEANIDTHMQMLGRVNRSGQTVLPEYNQLVADVPAERRPAAVLNNKMAELNANTTASRTGDVQSKDAPDFMNELGDKAAVAVMAENPDWFEQLGEPLKAEKGAYVKDGAIKKVTGRIPLLSLEDQEAIYDALEAEYESQLMDAISSGINPLEAKTLDLDAKTLETVEVVPRKEHDNPFADAVIGEYVDVKRTSKPLTTDKIKEKVAAFSDDPHQHTKDLAAKAIEEFKGYRENTISKMSEKTAGAADLRLDMIEQRFKELTRRFYPGKGIVIKAEDGNYYGVITGLKRGGKTKNPLALSSWKYDIAMINGDAPTIVLPMSRMHTKDSSSVGSGVVVQNIEMFEGLPIIDVFDTLQGDRREKRVILTGNILAAYDYTNSKGQITNYTDETGSLRQGLLMARGFDLIDFMKDKEVKMNVQGAIDFLKSGPDRVIETGEDNAKITYDVSTGYKIETASSKKAGGAIFLDKQLGDILGKDFYASSSKMVNTFTSSNEYEVFSRLEDIAGGLVVRDKDQKAAASSIMKKETSEHQSIKLSTAKIKQNLEPIKGAAQDLAKSINPDVNVEFVDSLFAVPNTNGNKSGYKDIGNVASDSEGRVELGGRYYSVSNLIQVSLNESSAEDIVTTTLHEVFHSIQSMLNGGEIRILEKAFPGTKRFGTIEHQAFAFQSWALKRIKVSSPVTKIFNKLITFLKNLGNAIRGLGFTSVDQVFSDALAGKVAGRPLGAYAKEMGLTSDSIAKISGKDAARLMKRLGVLNPDVEPNVEDRVPRNDNSISFIERMLMKPDHIFNKYAKWMNPVFREALDAKNAQSSQTKRFEDELNSIFEGLTPDEISVVSDIAFMAETYDVELTAKDLKNGYIEVEGERVELFDGEKPSDKLINRYAAIRRWLKKVGRLLDKHRRAMRKPAMKLKLTLLNKLSKTADGRDAIVKIQERYALLKKLNTTREGSKENIEARSRLLTLAEELESELLPAEVVDAAQKIYRADITLAATGTVMKNSNYIPHRFFGNFAVYKEVDAGENDASGKPMKMWELVPEEEQGFHQTYQGAIKAANGYAKMNRSGRYRVQLVTAGLGNDSRVLLSDREYYRMINSLKEDLVDDYLSTGMDLDTAKRAAGQEAANIAKVAAKKASRRAFFRAMKKRKGVEGYSRDIPRVLYDHGESAARYMAQDKIKYSAVNAMERHGITTTKKPSSDDPEVNKLIYYWFADQMDMEQPVEASIDQILNKPWVTPLNSALMSGAAAFVTAGGMTGNPLIGLAIGSYVGYRFYSTMQTTPHRRAKNLTGKMLTDMAHLKLGMVFNLFSPLVNSSQYLVNTGAILGYNNAAMGLVRFQKAIAEGRSEWIEHRKNIADGKYSEGDGSISQAARDYGLLQKNNIETKYLYTEHEQSNKKGIDGGAEKFGRASMFLFSFFERMNRGATFLAVYDMETRKAAKTGATISEKAIREKAMGIVNKTQFDYSSASKPEILRNVLLRVPLQFKNFMIQQLGFIYGLGKMAKRGDPAPLARFLTSTFLLAGALGMPGLDLLDTFIKWLLGDDKSPILGIKRAALELQARGALPGLMGDVVVRGMPSLINLDLSSRLGMGDRFILPTSMRDMRGPWVDSLAKVTQLGRTNMASTGDYMSALSPGLGRPLKAIESAANGIPISQAILTGNGSLVLDALLDGKNVKVNPWKRGRIEYNPTNMEVLLGAFGGRSMEEARISDSVTIANVSQNKSKNDTNKVVDEIIKAYRSGNTHKVSGILERARKRGIFVSDRQIRYALKQADKPRTLRAYEQLRSLSKSRLSAIEEVYKGAE